MKTNFRKKFPSQLQSLKTQSGVLLIEVMIAILIFSFGLLGLAGLQVNATQNSTNAEERIRASLLANDMVSMLWVKQSVNNTQTTAAISAASAADITAWQAQVAASSLPNAAGSVAFAGNLATITVQWKSPTKKDADNKNQYVTSIAVKS